MSAGIARLEVPQIRVLFVATGQIKTLSIDPTWRTEELKEQIQLMGGPPVREQYLTFGPYQLQEGKTLEDYSIQPDSMLNLLLRCRGE